MLQSNSKSQGTQEGYRGYMKEETVFWAGMNPNLEFRYAGVAPEPIQTWDEASRKYVDPIVGYRYPVVQEAKGDGAKVFRQNPVMVRVDGAPVNLSFGDLITFSGMLGYRNKSYKYSFQAESVQKVK
ncbi:MULTISPECIES: hypothetical protein [Levilactobacillus]|uniref:Uncharacterized protein n=1 Tax=Levilactobacillus suantsaiihabitans TaxID=2487722 RepID=A0A4Z0J9W4_9LACO|nr:hypothetical protein [Levilactobacillus suantsaiihabitans]TGD19474.1 hypothetical protein EGT51_04720 [Levilactobacillus suantsaiihabitans]